MTVLAPERTAEEVVAGWRRGLDEEGFENPAGPIFADGFVEFDITMTGGGGQSNLNTFEIISCAIPERYHGECCV